MTDRKINLSAMFAEMSRTVDKYCYPKGTVQVKDATLDVSENIGNAKITLIRTNGDYDEVSVNWSTANGTAKAGSDYVTSKGKVTWADGDTEPKEILVPIIDDTLPDEPDRNFKVTIHTPSGGVVIGNATTLITIKNDDVVVPPPPPPPTDDPLNKPLFTMDKLQFIGGMKLPATWVNGKSMAFSNGGLAIRKVGNKLSIYTGHHAHLGGAVQEFIVDPAKLSSDLIHTNWPMAEAGKYLGFASAVVNIPNGFGLKGYYWDEVTQTLYNSGRSGYAVPPQSSGYISRVTNIDAVPMVISSPVNTNVGTMQSHSGGFCDIPKWFADRFLGGRTLGIGQGGYESGQSSATGPTLAAAYRNTDLMLDCVSLLNFTWGAAAAGRESRPPDYSEFFWGPNPTDVNADGVLEGYWAADRVYGGPCWIETDTCHGLLYFTIQGCGPLNYQLQNDVFSTDRKSRVYIYHPKDIAAVASGTKKADQIRGSYFEYTLPFAGKEINGAHFDPVEKKLYLLQRWGYGDFRESYPILMVYQVQ